MNSNIFMSCNFIAIHHNACVVVVEVVVMIIGIVVLAVITVIIVLFTFSAYTKRVFFCYITIIFWNFNFRPATLAYPG